MQITGIKQRFKVSPSPPSSSYLHIRPDFHLFIVLGSISSTYLRTGFMPVAPKSVRIQSSCQYLFTLLGSTSIKAVPRTLMKLSPTYDVNYYHYYQLSHNPILVDQKKGFFFHFKLD